MADEDVKSPSIERLTWLRDELKPWLKKHFKQNGEDQSVLLAVAQYWADEADDAVHLTALASKSRVPDFFANEWNEEGATGDTRGVDWSNRPRWDDNGMSIRAFQAYCGELGSQELPSSSQAEPFLLAQRGEKGPHVTWLGRMQRPWLDLPHTGLPGFLGEDDSGDVDREPLDLVLPAQKLEPIDVKSLEAIAIDPFAEGPRRVWADVWMSRNDPRGAFMQQRNPALEQFMEHGEFWLGELNQVVPFSSGVFEYGSLSEADVAFDESRLHLAESPWWLSVHTLRFSGLHQVFSKQMRGLRHVRGLGAEGLLALVDFAGTSQLLSLQATLALSELEVLRALPLESLRSLSLTLNDGAALSGLKLPAWKHLEHVRISRSWQSAYEWDEDGNETDDGDEMPSLQELRAALPSMPRVSVSAADGSNLPSGWEVSLAKNDVASLRLERVGPTSRRQLLDSMLEGLPSAVKTIVLEPSVLWAPTTAFPVGSGRKTIIGTAP